MAYYPFGPLAPDLDPRGNDKSLRVAEGVYPTPDGYKPVGQWAQLYSTIGGTPKGGAAFISTSGVASIIAGTATGLYRAYSGAWEAMGTGYGIQGDQRWRFAQFGGVAIATNAVDNMVKINLDSMTASNLGGDPPKFEALAVVKGFLIGTVMNGDAMTIAWSGAYNAEHWQFGFNQSDYHVFPTGGRVNGIFGGEYGLVLQRSRLVRLDYVGGNLILDPNEVSSNVGCVSVHSAVQWGNLGFFLSDEGFMQWDGQGLTPIGRDMIDAQFAAAYDVGDWVNMSTAIDPARGLVKWSLGDKIYTYDWSLKRWTTQTIAAPIIFSGVTKGVTLDELDASVGATDDDIDGAALLSLDDSSFRGGDPRLYVFSSGNALGTLSGTPMAATFTMNDLEPAEGRRANLRFVRPDIDCNSGLTLTLATKQRLADAAASSSFTTVQANGDMPVRASGRYTRPTLAVAAGTAWTHAKGLELIGAPGAAR